MAMQEAGKTSNQYKQDEALSRLDTSQPEITPEVVEADADLSEWLAMARDAFETSDDYFESSLRGRIEVGLAHFQNRHAPGSKYYSELYKHRAKGFRPKTRGVVRKNEAVAARALFGSSDTVVIRAENEKRPENVVSAEIVQELVQYRLDHTIPWYQLTGGAYQDALKTSICISHQYWDYREATIDEPVIDPETGEGVLDEEGGQAFEPRTVVISDTPRVELRPIENIRLAPSADWEDPVNSSPYLIDMIPMEVGEVKLRASQAGKSETRWFPVDDAQLMMGKVSYDDSLRSQREAGGEDSKDSSHATHDFDTVWVHRNIIRRDGIDWVFYTLSNVAMLSEPVPLMMEYPHLKPGQRPYVIGKAIIESHRAVPDSLVTLSAPIQQEANDVANQRRDNVRLALNKRYFGRRGTNVDWKSLTYNVPGSVTLMDNLDDVKSEEMNDVTGSSYAEQERIDLDFDEIAGSFSQASVAGNRKLNETVGGMELMNRDSDEITDHQLRTWVITWVIPVLEQVAQLEQYYETDEALLQSIAEDLSLFQRYGVSEITDTLLQGNMTIDVNVGFGNTDPMQRIRRLQLGLQTIMELNPMKAQQMDGDAVAAEIFGALGYRGAADRFFPELTEEQKAQLAQGQQDPRLEVEQFRAQSQMQLEQMRQNFEAQLQQFKAEQAANADSLKFAVAQLAHQEAMMRLASEENVSISKIKAQLGETAMKERNSNARFAAEIKHAQTPAPLGGEGRGI